jgi:hypothetical protein
LLSRKRFVLIAVFAFSFSLVFSSPAAAFARTDTPLSVSCPSPIAVSDLSYGSTAVATGGSPPYSFTTMNLPQSFSIDLTTGFVGSVGVTAFPGKTYDFTVTVTDSALPTANSFTADCSITVYFTALTTKLSASPIAVGQPVSDTAFLFLDGDTGGAISWYYSTTETCTSPGTAFGSPSVDTVTTAGTYTSGSQTFASPGTYYVYAIYDPAIGPVINSGCETLLVTSSSVPQFPITSFSSLLLIALLLPAILVVGRKFRATSQL